MRDGRGKRSLPGFVVCIDGARGTWHGLCDPWPAARLDSSWAGGAAAGPCDFTFLTSGEAKFICSILSCETNLRLYVAYLHLIEKSPKTRRTKIKTEKVRANAVSVLN